MRRVLLHASLVVLALAAGRVSAPAQTAGVSGLPGLNTDDRTPTVLAERRATLESGVSTSRLAGPVNPATYRIGPGDQLLLHIRGQVSRDISLEVGPEGNILIPDDGLMSVAGRTLADVRADILGRVRRLYRNVDLELRLARTRTFRVYLTGQVTSPGPTLADGSFRVADVLTSGMLLGGSSHRGIELIHTDGSSEPCDLDLFLQTGNATWNPALRDGDVIQVPSATRFVHVEGAVARPGVYELGQRDSLRTLLRLAGDPLPSAVTEHMLVVRFRNPMSPESLWVSLSDIDAGRANLPLEDGERLYVYFLARYRLQHQASITGEVQRPGTYPIVEGITCLRDLVTAAQGFQRDADLSAIRVHRGSPQAAERDPELDRLLRLSRSELTASEYEVLRTRLAGLREDYRVDWAQLQDHHELDLLLRDGDSVRVERLISSVRVDGEVRRPGLLNYVRGESVNDCVAQAGGFTNRAWRSKVRVTRVVTGQTLLARNVRSLDPGDFVWVPERPDITQWDHFKEALTTLAQIATIVIAIRSVR